jgi:hypothetical protein
VEGTRSSELSSPRSKSRGTSRRLPASRESLRARAASSPRPCPGSSPACASGRSFPTAGPLPCTLQVSPTTSWGHPRLPPRLQQLCCLWTKQEQAPGRTRWHRHFPTQRPLRDLAPRTSSALRRFLLGETLPWASSLSPRSAPRRSTPPSMHLLVQAPPSFPPTSGFVSLCLLFSSAPVLAPVLAWWARRDQAPCVFSSICGNSLSFCASRLHGRREPSSGLVRGGDADGS